MATAARASRPTRSTASTTTRRWPRRCTPGGTPSPATRAPAPRSTGSPPSRAWRALGEAAVGGQPRQRVTTQVAHALRSDAIKRRVSARGRRAQPRRARPAARGHLQRRAAPRRALRAMGEVAARLDLGDAHVVFGHTHRAGPLPGDDPQRVARSRGGARLVNTGCWTYAAIFLTATPGESPYWPGTCVLVEDDGPPVLSACLASTGTSSSRRSQPVQPAEPRSSRQSSERRVSVGSGRRRRPRPRARA